MQCSHFVCYLSMHNYMAPRIRIEISNIRETCKYNQCIQYNPLIYQQGLRERFSSKIP